jgi:hypothetical protein
LATEAGVLAEVQRLLLLPTVQERVTALVAEVLGADKALTSARDAATFPELDQELRQAMTDEMNDFIQRNLFGGKPLSELFSSRQALVSDKLAAFYGVAHAGPPSLVELPADQRGGVLTRGATLLSLPTGSRSVHRGLFIAHHYLCRDLPEPPAAVQAQIEQTLALGLTERQMTDLRASKVDCAGCHALFDSLGLAFEHYDFIGKYLTERDGAAVDASGELSYTDVDGPFADAIALADRLATSRTVAVCLSQRLAGQVLGRALDQREGCAVEHAVEPWSAGARVLGELVPLLTRSSFFLRRAKGN